MGRVDKEQDYEEIEGIQDQITVCLVCGFHMIEVHCKSVCPRCGFCMDCSD